MDISKNELLLEVDCEYNKLTVLNLSKDYAQKENNYLEKLSCGNNRLTKLDIANNKSLSSLHCEKNLLTILDVSRNKFLKELVYKGNPISFLDVSNNTALKFDYKFYEQAQDEGTQLKLPDEAQVAKEAERLRLEERSRKIVRPDFACEGSYLAMPFTQRDNHTHFQSLWYVGAEFSLTIEEWEYSREGHRIAFGGGIYSVPFPQMKNGILPALSISYTKNDFYNGYNLDCKITASTYHINPSIGLSMLNFLKLHIGYSFSTRPYYSNTDLKGFTIGGTISFGSDNIFKYID